MAEDLAVLRIANAAVFSLLAAASFLHWRRRHDAAAGWLTSSFGVLALVLVEGLIFAEDPQGALEWVQKLSIAALFFFPYFLYRFTTSFGRIPRRVDAVARGLTALVAVWALFVPSGDSGADRATAVQIFLIAVMVQWTGLSLLAAVKLWRAGRAQSTPGRRRMRLLSGAATGLSAAIVLAGLGGSGDSAGTVIVQFLALGSGVLFFLGFSPPRILRLLWRHREEEQFQKALRELMTANRAEVVAARLLPHVTDIVAGRGAALLDDAGRIIGRHGQVPEGIEDRTEVSDSGGGGPEVRIPMRSGSLLVWASPYAPFFAEDEFELLSGLGTLADLALERVRLAERGAQLAEIVNSTHDAVISKTLDGVITSWNRGAQEIYGYSEEEAVGRPISMLVPPGRDDEIPQILARIARGDRIDNFETFRRRKDGRVITVSLSISPLRDAGGKVVGAAAIARDVTERNRAEQIIRDQADMLDQAQDAILARDLDGRISYWNRGAMEAYGYSKEEAVGRIYHELLSTTFPRPRAEIEAEVLRDGRWEGELVHTRRDGSVVNVSTRWTLRMDESGVPLGVLHVATDITGQKEAARALQAAKEEAERANMAKSEFLSRMSHELRTPLNAILGFGQLLELEQLAEEHKGNVAEIVKAGRHLLDLINEVLDIARIEVGELAISLEPVAVDDVVGEAASLIRPLADERGLALSQRETGCRDLHVLADKQRLKQVLLNLLSNAIKYNVEGGSVQLSCDTSDQTARIAVSDTGSGIPEDKLPYLFVPFERLGAETGSEEGAGLGLALVKRLAEAMGGTIGLETAMGKGTTFWVELRRAEHPLRRARGPAEGTSMRHGHDVPLSRTLLYVEDNLSSLKLVERILKQRPEIALLTAMQGQVGLELAREHQPDLILLDIQLPDISGNVVLSKLKIEPATRDIPVVVVSADATDGQIRRLLKDGAQAFLTKPLDVRDFLRLLDEHAARHASRDAEHPERSASA